MENKCFNCGKKISFLNRGRFEYEGKKFDNWLCKRKWKKENKQSMSEVESINLWGWVIGGAISQGLYWWLFDGWFKSIFSYFGYGEFSIIWRIIISLFLTMMSVSMLVRGFEEDAVRKKILEDKK